MMIRKNLLSLAMGTTLCSVGLFTVASTPGTTGSRSESLAGAWTPAPDQDSSDLRDFFFGLRIAGVYLNTFQVAGGATVTGISTFHADGTYNSVDDNDALPADPDTITSGVWERTGFLEVTTRQLNQNFDANGVLEQYVRTDLVIKPAPDLQSATFTGTIDIFLASQDPLDPNTMPVLSVPVAGTSRRMNTP